MVDQLNTFVEKDNTPEGHNEAMLAKASQLENPTQVEELPQVSDRPEWLPEKFNSAEDMAKAYAELEKKLSQPKDQTPAAKEATKEDQAPNEEAAQVANVLENAGINFDSLQQEYETNGGLSAESYEQLQKAGFPRSIVDSWIAGQEAVSQDITQSVFESVGGESQYEALMGWAGQNLSTAEINAFNRQVDSGDPDLVRFAVQGLNARYRSEVGNEPRLIKGAAATTSSGAFQSSAELTAAMRDPRYAQDPAYRRQVAERLAKSDVF